MKTTKTKVRRTPKRFSTTLYAYVTPENQAFAQGWGRKNFKSTSNYLDTLITLDRKLGMTSDYVKNI